MLLKQFRIKQLRVSINAKLLIAILLATAIIYSAFLGYISVRFKNEAIEHAIEAANQTARFYAGFVSSELNKDLEVARELANVFYTFRDMPYTERGKLTSKILRRTIETNSNYIAVFEQWELSNISPGYTAPYGRFRKTAYRSKKGIFSKVDTLDLNGDDTTGIYYHVKKNKKEYIINPYFYSYTRDKDLPSPYPKTYDAILESTVIVPIIENNKMIGMTGMDIPLMSFQQMIDSIKPFEKSYAFLLSNNASIVAHPQYNKLRLKSIKDAFNIYSEEQRIVESIKNGKSFSYFHFDPVSNSKSYITFAPITIGKTGQPWSFGMSVPVDVISEDANKHFLLSVLFGLFGLLVLSLFVSFISKNITHPLTQTTILLNKLARGELNPDNKLQVYTNDEIGEMTKSANTLIDGLNKTAAFARSIGEGNLNTTYSMLSKNDVLGHALIEMQQKLRESKEEIRAQAEQLLQKNIELEKLSIVARETHNAIMIMDSNGEFLWFNEGAVRLYGYTIDEYRNVRGATLLKSSLYPDIESEFENCIKNKVSVSYPSLNITKDGRHIWAQSTLTPILNNSGNIEKVIAIDTDITKRKKAEAEIMRQKDEIEKQRDELSHLNATKDKFFSIIAHDLRNPFTVLLSITQELATGYDNIPNDEMLFYIRKVYDSSKRLYNLLENLLEWSRSQTGRIEYKPEHICLQKIVDSEVQLLRLQADNKEIDIKSDIEGSCKGWADKNMIQTVLRNLMTNAVKFTPKQGRVIVKSERSNGKIVVSVIDSGIGMKPEDVQKLFRLDIKTKSIGTSKEKGTGLGLILCKEFIEKNDGNIWVESTVNKGSTFKFSIPVRD